jgi:1,4-dihydroxy-2-naphthoate octaprenyltransferase
VPPQQYVFRMLALRRLRGLLGFAVVSAIAWIPLGWIATVVLSFANGSHLSWGRLFRSAPELAVTGAICGVISAIILAAAERRRSVADLTYGRMGLWGLLGGVAVTTGFLLLTRDVSVFVTPFIVLGAMGAATPIAVLALARRAPAVESLPAGDESPDKSLAP